MERDATTTAAQARAIHQELWGEPTDSPRDGRLDASRRAADAVRPLIVGEEHDRLRREIETLGLERDRPPQAWSDAIEEVLALLGESTKDES